MIRGSKGELAFRGTLDVTGINEGAKEASDKLRGISQTAQKEGASIKKALMQVGQAVGIAFGVQQATAFVRQMVSVRSEIQALEVSFRTLLGSQEASAELMHEMKEFAAATPLQLGDLARGAQTMLGFNVAAEEVMPMLRAIGDISMGDAQRFQSLTLAFSQMRSVGKLMGQDLLQMVNAGFNPLATIAEETGQSIAELKEQMSAGALSAEDITKAFISATSVGGKFHGMLESQGETVRGSIAQLQGAVTDMLNELGTSSEGIVRGTVGTLQWLIQHYKQIGTVLAGIIATYGTYRAIMITVVALERLQVQLALAKRAGMTKWGALLEVLKAKQLALNKAVLANPYVLLAAAIVGATYAVYKLATAESAAETARRKHNDAMDEAKEKLDQYKESVDEYLSVLRDDTATQLQRVEAYEKLLQLLPQLQGKSFEEVSSMASSDLERAKNAETDARHYKELQEQAVEAQRAVEEAQRALDSAINNPGMGPGAGTGIATFAKILEERKEALRLAKQEVKAHEELQKRAEWEAKTQDEKVAYLKDQLAKTEAIRQSYADQLPPQARQLALAGRISEALASCREETGGLSIGMQGAVQRTAAMLTTVEQLRQQLRGVTAETPQSYTDALKAAEKAYTDAQKALEVAKQGTVDDYRKAQEELQKAKEAYEALGGDTSAPRRTAPTRDRESELRDERRRQRQLTESREAFQREQYRKEVDNAFALSRARIDAMEDGLAKELELARLHTERLKEENRRRQEDWIATLHRQRTEEWELQHPKEADKGLTYTGTTTRSDLTKTQLDQLTEYERIATETQLREETEALKKRLQAYETYSDQRRRILEEYQKAERELYTKEGKPRQGVTQGNLDELDRQREQALEEVDRTFAERQEAYQSWLDDIAQMSLAKLEEELLRITALLQTAESDGADDASLSRLRAQVKALAKDLEKAHREARGTKQSFEDWSRLTETLRGTRTELESIARELSTFSEPLADIVSGVAQLTAPVISAISGIARFAQLSQEGISSTATATQKALALAERGTVILAILSSAVQLITKVVDLFNHDKERDKRIETLTRQLADLQWRITHMGWDELEESAGKPLDHITQMLQDAKAEAIALAGATGSAKEVMRAFTGETIDTARVANNLADAYMRADYMAGKAFGSERYRRVRKEMELLAQQMVLIQRQREEEEAKKKSDQGKIDEYEKKQKELAEQMAQTIDGILTDLLGGDAFALADKLGDALFDAFSRGEDAAKAFGATVDDIVRNMVKTLLIQQFLEEPIRNAINKMKEQATKDGKLDLEEFYALAGIFKDELTAIGEQAKEMPNILDSILNGLGIDPESESLRGDRKGIATASQDSIDELNGRATAIQTHTASIADGTRRLVTFAESTMQYVADIARLVKEGNASRQHIETHTASIATKIRDFDTYGIKTKR